MSRVNPLTLLACLLPGVGYLLLFFGLPLLNVILGSFTSRVEGAPPVTLQTWASLFANPVYMDGLWFSLWLGLAPTALSLLISLPLSALMQANETSQKLFGTLYRIPLVVPGVVAGFLVLVILDRGGIRETLPLPRAAAAPAPAASPTP